MRLRQIALVGRDLEAARADITAVLGLGGAYADPGVGKYGLHVNSIISRTNRHRSVSAFSDQESGLSREF